MKGGHSTSVRVRYSEVDRMGLLYHVTYLEYFELARSSWVRDIWKPYKEIEDEGYCLVVIEARLSYHRSAYYDDELVVEIQPSDWGHNRITFEYTIYRRDDPDPLCTGSTVHCFIGKQGKLTRMPEELKRKLELISSC